MLTKELLQKKFLCGILRTNRLFLPIEMRVKQKKSDIISVQKQSIKFIKWTDKRPVLILEQHVNSTNIPLRRSLSEDTNLYKSQMLF